MRALNLPPSYEHPEKGSKSHKRFLAEYGPDPTAYELEALPPATLQSFVRETINSVVEHDLLNREIEAEKEDARNLEALRKTMLATLKFASN